jgi:rfaE bifunctional protein kinase chain/domain
VTRPSGPSTDSTRFTRERLLELFGKMKERRIVVVGDAMLDVYLAGDAERLSPEAPVPVVSVRSRRTALGGAGNVAANVAATGAECRLVAVLGDDSRGNTLRSEMAQAHLADRYLVSVPGRPTTSKTRVMARGQQVLRIDEEVDESVPARAEQQILAQLEPAFHDADALLLEDYNKGTLTTAVIERSLELARQHGVPVVVDPKFRNFFAYRGATVFKPNRRELEQAMGAALDLDQPAALPTSLASLGVDNLLLTLGPDGMVLVTKDGEITRIPSLARDVYDVSGAGDTVTAWVGTGLAAGASVREAARLANYAAGIEVGKSGVATVAPDEVLTAHDLWFDELGKFRRGGLL